MRNHVLEHREQYARWILQLGLAFVLIYAGVGALTDPVSWKAYVPGFLSGGLRELVFQISTWGELLLAGWLLSGQRLVIPSFLTALFLALIVLFNLSLLDVVFRNVGLMAGALALGVLAWDTQRPQE
ncbi:MAG: hypothetical protein BRC23_02310 [Parcubacteria group bacterium SW_4_49_11]|nr:MAG: hypothetical protein BRC23_02310 [Parcubacteria group bacterium SW_4_49_11]